MGSERVVSVLSDGHTVPEHVEILEGRHSTVGFSSMQLQGPASEESAKSEVTEDALKLSRMVGSETPDECFSPVTGGGLVLRDLEITQPSVVSGKSSELSPVAWRKPRGGEVEFSPVVVEAKEDYDDAFSQSRMMPSRLHSLTPHARTTGGYESEMPEEVTAPGHGGPVRALRERRFRRRDRAMPELCDIHTLACTQLFPFALKFCSGSALSMLRAAGPIFSEAIPESSPLWKELLQESSAWLHDSKTSLMHKAHRLSVAAERCRFDREDGSLQVPHPTPVNKSRRYRLIVTGARRSGISTLVRIMAGREELDNQGKDMSLVNFSADLDGQVLSISAVDKRSTAIVTPLSAALYNGHSAALFVFDAANADSLKTTACCIAELQQTVGPQKFRRMPKLLVCHKADVLPKVEDRLAELPAMCEALLSTYGMDLVFTTREDPSSIHLAVALAAEHWPEADPDDASRKFPAISRQQLRPTRTVVRRNTVVNLPPRRPANILEELRSRVPRIE